MIEKNSLDKLLVELICDPRKINISDYPKTYFVGTMLHLVTKTEGYYWNIFNKQRLTLIEKILKDGANPNQLNSDGIPLIFCSLEPFMFKGFAITELLLKYGADPSIKYQSLTLLNKINKNYTNELLSLLLKYDYVMVDNDNPFYDHVLITHEETIEKNNDNSNYFCYKLCCIC